VTAPAPPRGAARELGRFLEIQNLGLNLPFAVAFVVVASGGWPGLWPFVLLLVAFVAARNAGHSFNRWADLRYDRLNPRTQDRALVAGRYAPSTALAITAASAAVLAAAAYLLNPLALLLLPVALAVVLGYSYTKRFTALTTVVLGLVEGIIPAAVYIGLTGTLPAPVLFAVAGLLAWGTAFEVIHSLGDLENDRQLGLHSLPLALGRERSVRLVPVLHGAALLGLALFGWGVGLAWPYFVALAVIAALAAPIDVGLARHPDEVARSFRFHFVLGAVFFTGVTVSIYLPWT
jgi:4-hydroxybenzoate polyprenyltransferase